MHLTVNLVNNVVMCEVKMNKFYPSKKAKRRAKYIEREDKRELIKAQHKKFEQASTMEEMASALGIKLR